MRSPVEWWTARSRPLSARGHLHAIVFWLIFTAFLAHQLLTGYEGSALRWIWLAVGLTNLAVLMVSYRNTLRVRRETLGSSADGDAERTAGAE